MKKIWFKRKTYGWGWTPLEVGTRCEPSRPLTGYTFGTWESVVVMAIYIALNIYIFSVIDVGSHSGSDTLIHFTPRFLLLTVALYLVCYIKGEKPRWQPIRRIRQAHRRQAQGKWSKGVAEILTRGGIAVMPTDTTYGIVGSALNEKTVNEIYRLRKRDLNKPFIVLIADRKDLKKFGVRPTSAQEEILRKVWPGAVSVILPCAEDKFAYLHRGKKTLAFRLPDDESLRAVLRETGPLVAPSANPQGHSVAKTVSEAKAYFGHHISFYQDGGTIFASPSKLIDITDGTEKVIRA